VCGDESNGKGVRLETEHNPSARQMQMLRQRGEMGGLKFACEKSGSNSDATQGGRNNADGQMARR